MTLTTYKDDGVLMFDASRRALRRQLGMMTVQRYSDVMQGQPARPAPAAKAQDYGWQYGQWCKIENPHQGQRKKDVTITYAGLVWFPSIVSPGRIWILLFERKTGELIEPRIVDYDWLMEPPHWWYSQGYVVPEMPRWATP